MTSLKATIKDRRIELTAPDNWPDGTEVEIRALDKRVDGGEVPMDRAAWLEFIERTAGSITDPTFMRHPQGEVEEREPLQ